jgi:hypothetical protein
MFFLKNYEFLIQVLKYNFLLLPIINSIYSSSKRIIASRIWGLKNSKYKISWVWGLNLKHKSKKYWLMWSCRSFFEGVKITGKFVYESALLSMFKYFIRN